MIEIPFCNEAGLPALAGWVWVYEGVMMWEAKEQGGIIAFRVVCWAYSMCLRLHRGGIRNLYQLLEGSLDRESENRKRYSGNR